MANELDKLIVALGNSQRLGWAKTSISNQAAGIWCSLWRATGDPQQGAIPTSAAACDDTLLGGYPLSAPVVGEQLYIAKAFMQSANVVSLVVYDRLAHMGGLSGTVATAQTVNLSVATAAGQGRCQANGSDVQWMAEWYTDTGGTAVTMTASYTDEGDVSGCTTPSISLGATRRASMCYKFDPQQSGAGRYIKSIQTLTLSATTGTAGNFGVTARKKLFEIPLLTGNGSMSMDFASLAFPLIKEQSCLEILLMQTTTTSGQQIGSMDIVSIGL